MLKFSKNILRKVSFDPTLFKKELAKSTRWLNKQEMGILKIWALTYFAHYKQNILEVFDSLS
jgi:hypothetical protein|tara:strand:- start:894 stop:1079 length:186 start_codon:yes stop_codon:yes gene_type:complete